MRMTTATLLLSCVVACSADDASAPSGTTDGPAATTDSGGAPADRVDGGGSVDPVDGVDGGNAVNGVPTNAADMNAFLQQRGYASWAKESAQHPSTGPHGGIVLTYVNPELDASLKAGNAEHPSGAAAVKEFYSGGKVSGF